MKNKYGRIVSRKQHETAKKTYKKRFGDKMAKEVFRGNMFHHVPGFAQQVGKPEKMIHNFIKNEQWEELIREVTK